MENSRKKGDAVMELCKNSQVIPCEGTYIVDRVCACQYIKPRFEGKLSLFQTSCGLCPPFDLRYAEIQSAESIGNNQIECMLRCFLTDCQGRQGESFSKVRLFACLPACPYGLNVYWSGEVCINKANFLAPCAFDVFMTFHLTACFCRKEMVGKKLCWSESPFRLPLYPQPASQSKSSY